MRVRDCRIANQTRFGVEGIGLVLATALLVLLFSKLPASAYPPEPTTAASGVEPGCVYLDGSPVVQGHPSATGIQAAGWTDIMTEDFEGAFPGTRWSLFGDPTWDREGYRAHNGSYSGYCAGGGTQAVDPPGPYPNDMHAMMAYGPFDLSEASDAELLFSFWNQSESEHDKLFVGARKEASGPYYGVSRWGDFGGWENASFDLTDVHSLGDLTGEPEVWIAFSFRSNESGTYEGAYLDDIVLRAYVASTGGKNTFLPIVLRPRIVASQVVGTDEEGLVEHPSGAQIQVPRGAVPLNRAGGAGEMLFTIEQWSPEECEVPDTPPAGASFVGHLHSMGPEGFIFERPVRVTMPFPEGFDATQGLVSMYDYDPVDEAWKQVGGRVNREGTGFSADVLHLCWNWLFLTMPGDQMDGALEFDGMSGYEFEACIQDYTLKYVRPGTGWEAEDQSCWVPQTGSGAPDDKTLWSLPQGTYTIQIHVTKAGSLGIPPEPLGYFERTVAIDHAYNCEGYPGPCDGQIPVELQTTGLTEGRPPCMGVATPSVGVGELNVRLEWEARADLDLWVIDPCGNKIFYNTPGGGASCQGSWGQLDLDNECDNLVLGRPENIFWDRDPPRGTYKVYVDYFSDCASGETVDFKVRRLVRGKATVEYGTLEPPPHGNTPDDEVLIATFTY